MVCIKPYDLVLDVHNLSSYVCLVKPYQDTLLTAFNVSIFSSGKVSKNDVLPYVIPYTYEKLLLIEELRVLSNVQLQKDDYAYLPRHYGFKPIRVGEVLHSNEYLIPATKIILELLRELYGTD